MLLLKHPITKVEKLLKIADRFAVAFLFRL